MRSINKKLLQITKLLFVRKTRNERLTIISNPNEKWDFFVFTENNII